MWWNISALGLLYLSVSRQMMFPLTPQITANTKSLDEIESKCKWATLDFFLIHFLKKYSHLISNFSLKTASYHGKSDKMQQQHLKEPQQIKSTLLLSSSLSPLQSTLLSLKVHALFTCQSLVVTSPLSESILHKRLFKTDSNPEYQSSIATD